VADRSHLHGERPVSQGPPTWKLIDDAQQFAGVAEGFANTVSRRRDGGDARLAQQAADAFARGQRLLGMVERNDDEDEGGDDGD
jgi:hypothetical protein